MKKNQTILQNQLVQHFLRNLSIRIRFLMKKNLASSNDLVHQENTAVHYYAVEQNTKRKMLSMPLKN